MIKPQQLKHALALGRHGNFRRAAEAVHLSQPAFSRSIKALENQLGVLLFDRLAGTVEPTVFGEALLKHAQTIVDGAGELEREIALLSGLETGSFSVGMGAFAAAISGAQAAGEVVHLHPNLKYQFSIGDWFKLGSRVLSGELDLVLAEVSEAQKSKNLQTEVVSQHQIIFYCRSGHPLAKLAKPSKADMADYPLVGVRIPNRVASAFPGIQRTDPTSGSVSPSIEIEDFTSAKTIVKASNAISGAALVQLEPELRSGEIICLPWHSPAPRFIYGFIYRRDRMLSPAAKVFMQQVRTKEQELVAIAATLADKFLPVGV